MNLFEQKKLPVGTINLKPTSSTKNNYLDIFLSSLI